jgi:hypothetical protein
MIFSSWWKSVEFWHSYFFPPKCRIGVECLTRGGTEFTLTAASVTLMHRLLPDRIKNNLVLGSDCTGLYGRQWTHGGAFWHSGQFYSVSLINCPDEIRHNSAGIPAVPFKEPLPAYSPRADFRFQRNNAMNAMETIDGEPCICIE